MFRVQGSRFKVESFNLEHGTLNIEPPLGTTAARWLFFNNLSPRFFNDDSDGAAAASITQWRFHENHLSVESDPYGSAMAMAMDMNLKLLGAKGVEIFRIAQAAGQAAHHEAQ